MHVQIAANIADLHQMRQAALGGGVDLALILAQFRRDPRQPQPLVDFLFRFAREFAFIRRPEKTVLVELEAHADGAIAQGDVVILAASEVLQGGAEAVARKRAQVDLQVFRPDFRAGFVFAFAQHLGDARIGDESFQRGRHSGPCGEDVHIADGFLAAAQTARNGDLFDAARLAQMRDDLRGGPVGKVQQEAAGALAVSGDGAQNLFFELGAHARQLAQFLFARDALQIVDGADAVVFPQHADALRPEPLDL